MCTLQCEQKAEKKSSKKILEYTKKSLEYLLTKSMKIYISGLFICPNKKNCSTISIEKGVSYNSVHKCFDEFKVQRQEMIQSFLVNLVKMYATKENPGVLVIDPTQIDKIYGKKSKLICYDYNGSRKSVLKGMTCVTAVWTNTKVVIPLGFDFWIREKDISDDRKYRKKTEISRELIFELKDKIPFAYTALDGDYGNEAFLLFLYQYRLKFSIRMPSSRNVVIDGIEETLKKHPKLKLIRNERYKKTQGFYKGIPVIIVAHKRKGKNKTKQVVFIVSNIEGLSAKEHVKAYACRWPIEKMFRTTKQKLGLKDCQCGPEYKHRAHIFFVFLAFVKAESIKIANRQKSTAEAIRTIKAQGCLA